MHGPIRGQLSWCRRFKCLARAHLHSDATISAVRGFVAWLRPVSASWRFGRHQLAVRLALRELPSPQPRQVPRCLVKVRVPFLLPGLLRSDAMGKLPNNDLNAANTTASVQASRSSAVDLWAASCAAPAMCCTYPAPRSSPCSSTVLPRAAGAGRGQRHRHVCALRAPVL